MPLTKLNATLGLTGSLPAVSGANLTGISAGKVLQVQSFFLNNVSSVQSNSSSFQDSALTDQITPASASNKVFVMVHLNGHRSHATSGNAIITVNRAISGGSSTDIGGNQTFRLAHTYVTNAQMSAFMVLDSPNTTSAIDYTVQYRSDNSGANCEIMRHTTGNSITLMEIEG